MFDYIWINYQGIILPLIIGLLFSGFLFLIIGFFKNSRKIPLERVLFRSAGVMPLTLVSWFFPSFLMCIVINEVAWLQSIFIIHLQLSLVEVAWLAALLLPQIA